ncbi:ubiquitin carboxyl-terminal hydrolase 19-like isoform X1 [Lampetra fluviatilis]
MANAGTGTATATAARTRRQQGGRRGGDGGGGSGGRNRHKGAQGQGTGGGAMRAKQKEVGGDVGRGAAAAARTGGAAACDSDMGMEWTQSGTQVTVRLRPRGGSAGGGGPGGGDLSDLHKGATFTDHACMVALPDGGEWRCELYGEVEASCCRAEVKERGGVLQLTMPKRIPLYTWPTLTTTKKKPAEEVTETSGVSPPRLTESAKSTTGNGTGIVPHRSLAREAEETVAAVAPALIPSLAEAAPPASAPPRPVGKKGGGGGSGGKAAVKAAVQGAVVEAAVSPPTVVEDAASTARPDLTPVSADSFLTEPDTQAPAGVKVEAPVETTPVETSVETPLPTPIESQVETPVQTPMESQVETPVATLVERQVETPVQTTVESPLNTPLESQVETPVATLMESQVETPVESVGQDMEVAVGDSPPVNTALDSGGQPLRASSEGSGPSHRTVASSSSPPPPRGKDLTSVEPPQEVAEYSLQPNAAELKAGTSRVDGEDLGSSVSSEAGCETFNSPPLMCTAAPEPRRVSSLRHGWYEVGADSVGVQVYKRDIAPSDTHVIFRDHDFTLIFTSSDRKFLEKEGVAGSGPTVFSWQVKLRNGITPDECSFVNRMAVVEIKLRKKQSQKWGALEAPSNQGAVGGARVACPASEAWKTAAPAGQQVGQPPAVGQLGEPLAEPRANRTANVTANATATAAARAANGAESEMEVAVVPALGCAPCVGSGGAAAAAQRTLERGAPPMVRSGRRDDDEGEDDEEEGAVAGAAVAIRCHVDGDREAVEGRRHGYTGLINLGNTCFMSSVIQCLSNTRELRDFFLDKGFEAELNMENPLGTGGRLASCFGRLLHTLWSGTQDAVAPARLKSVVGGKACQFTGYSQHDAQEFMAFLLDGLHEDLNRVRHKPYTATVDSDGRPDAVVAEEAWARHRQRNDSFVVDLFQGQYKSTLVCPICSKVSITFDPFLYLPVPLPQQQRMLNVNFYSRDAASSPREVTASVDKAARVLEVLDALSEQTGVERENLRLIEVCGSALRRVLLPPQPLEVLPPGSRLLCFELPAPTGQHEQLVVMSVSQRLMVSAVPVLACAFCRQTPGPAARLRRCTKCFCVSYCNTSCQKSHWEDHRHVCRPEPVGSPFVLALPATRLTYTALAEAASSMARLSVTVTPLPREYPPPIPPPRDSPSDDHPAAPALPCSSHPKAEAVPRPTGPGEAQGSAEPDGARAAAPAAMSAEGEETAAKGGVARTAGAQFPFVLRLVENGKESEIDDKGEMPLALPVDAHLVLEWRNHERYRDAVAVVTREMGGATGGVVTLQQCLQLFTRPEKLAPEEAWYCPVCKTHRQASKQLSLWRLPNVLIVQLKRFSFRNLLWRDKLNSMVAFPVRELDLSEFGVRATRGGGGCSGGGGDGAGGGEGPGGGGPPPVYDLYGVINHYGGMVGGHYTAFARLPHAHDTRHNHIGWRLFDDSAVVEVDESDVVTRHAYVLLYRRRDSPVPRPSAPPAPHAGVGASNAGTAGAVSTRDDAPGGGAAELAALSSAGARLREPPAQPAVPASPLAFTDMEEVD